MVIKKLISSSAATPSTHQHHVFPLAMLSETLAWFWIIVSSSDTIEGDAGAGSAFKNQISKLNTASFLRKRIANILAPSICAAVVSLCHASLHEPGSSVARTTLDFQSSPEHPPHPIPLPEQQQQQQQHYSENICLSDYFDSDNSTKDWGNEADDDEEEERNKTTTTHVARRQFLLRLLCKTVQCIDLVFSRLSDKMASTIFQCILTKTSQDFFLPLLVVRALTGISGFALEEFSDYHSEDQQRENNKNEVVAPSSSKKGLWAPKYPFGFRTAGLQLDGLLHKAYRCLHGIHLVSHHASNSSFVTSNHHAEGSKKKKCFFPPENAKKSVQLYRCVVRTYANCRRSLPIDALQCVALSLPPDDKTDDFRSIQNYIFKRNGKTGGEKEEKDGDNLTQISTNFPPCVLKEHHTDDTNKGESSNTGESRASKHENDIYLVRKGICEHLVEGPIPRLGSSSTSSMKPTEDANTFSHSNEERKLTEATEVALYEKTTTIIDTLNYDPQNCLAWYRAGICLGIKADIIMDRINRTKPACSGDFYLPKFSSLAFRQAYFNEDIHPPLHFSRNCHTGLGGEDRNLSCSFLGLDLHIYMKYRWSNFSTLKSIQPDFGDDSKVDDDIENLVQNIEDEREIFYCIQSKYSEGK